MQDARTALYYDIVHEGLTEDRDFYVALAREEGGAVCELGAGSGRIAIPIARAGVEVTAVDVSTPMLERLRARLADEPTDVRARVTVVSGDMRTWRGEQRFAQVFIPFRVFLALRTREDRHACLVNCRELLVPGGRLALNVFHPSMAYMRQFSFEAEGSWREVGRYPLPGGATLHWSQTARFDRLCQTVSAVYRWTEQHPDGTALVTDEPLELGYVYRDELLQHLALAGLEVEHVWGGFQREALEREGQEMVVLARRPG